MRRADSREKTLMLGKIEGRRRRGRQRIRWWDSITYSMDMSLSESQELVMERKAWPAAVNGVTKSLTWLSEWTKLPESRAKWCQYFCCNKQYTISGLHGLWLKVYSVFLFCFVYTGFLKFSSSLKLSIHWSQTIIISKYSTNHIHFFPQKTSLELFPVLNDIRATKRGWLSLSQFPDEIIRNPQKSPTSSPKWPKHSDIRFWKKAIQMQPGSKRPHSIHGWR